VSRRKKRWIKIGIICFSLLLIVDIIAGFYFYNLAIERNKKEFLQGNKDLEVSAEAMEVFTKGDWKDWVREQDFEEWELTSFDGLKLKGYFLEAKQPTNKVVVFAHGYLGRASDMGIFGQYYVEELGYNMFTADLRGHGDSEGDYIGFGWHDRLDYVDWIEMIVDKLGPDTEIVLHGVSMGAATVLMVSGEELPDNVKAIVADSPYTSVYELFDYQLDRMFHLPAFPILPTTSFVTKLRADYSFKEASALSQVKKAKVPILYIHGNDDTFVPTEMSFQLYDNTPSEKEMITFDDSMHGEAIVMHRDEYLNKLTEFLGKYVD
jgi:uncharacterized protein